MSRHFGFDGFFHRKFGDSSQGFFHDSFTSRPAWARLVPMKKVIRILVVLLVVLILAVVAGGFFLGSVVKKGVETVGPKVAKVEIKLDSASLSPLSGHGALKGLFVGNPAGFDSPFAIKAGEISVAMQSKSVLSDKIVVNSVRIIAPEITIHGAKGDNLQKILENLGASTGGSTTNKTAKPEQGGKKLQVDDFIIKDAKLRVVLPVVGSTPAVPMPEIHLTDLGKGADGITPAELTGKVLNAILTDAIAVAPQAIKAATDLGKGVIDGGKKVLEGIKNPFK
jgi:hypothetical protein